MVLNEVGGYAVEVAKWAGMVGGGFAAYYAVLSIPAEISAHFSEKIKSQEDLDKIVKQEAEKLDIPKPTVGIYYYREVSSNSTLGDDGIYRIHMGGHTARRLFVKHELYHIHKRHHEFKKRHNNRLLKFADYWFRQEPQVTAYQYFGLKL